MAKQLNILLTLKDKFTSPLKKVNGKLTETDRKLLSASNQVKKFGRAANNAFLTAAKGAANLVKNVAKAGAAALTAAGGLGLHEAMNMEGYKMQLETATKSTQKASDIMRYAIQLANKTPFEGGEMVEGAAKFEAMGMAAKKWLPLAGDMAAATNKSLDQAVEALIDAQNGEWERMKEFGIKGVKDMDTLVGMMNDRFTGGMEKQATTLKGLWSTVTGISKSALATIIGITEDGSIRQGSALDLIKGKIKTVADTLQQWQADGTIDAIAEKFTNGLAKALDFVGNAINFVRENASWLVPVLSGVVGAFSTFNTVKSVVTVLGEVGQVINTVKTGGGLLNAVLAAGNIKFVLIAAAIGAVIAAGVWLITNWDEIKAAAQALWDKITEAANGIKEVFVGAWNAISDAAHSALDWIAEKIEGIKSAANGLLDQLEKIPVVGGAIGWVRDVMGTEVKTTPKPVSRHALGTSYFKGGLTSINEGGRGEIVDLPNGTRIIPHDVSKKQPQGSNITVQVTVMGNVIGNREYMEETGEYVAQKVLDALATT